VTRILDLIISLFLIVVAFPIVLVCVVAIKLDSDGPFLFRQVRVGLGGKPFVLLKLRTMCQDAEEKGPRITSPGDARITRVGSFLRKWSIDELPQLWNVIVGEMSLVGPRPATVEQEQSYPSATWKKRHSARPGITGIAQAVNRSSGTMRQNRRLDLVGVSLAGDPCAYMCILVRTFFAVALRKNLN
jgi:lipopolysaccharide/colanic/teichoic acid biosynthesis glycosyltransferase